MTKRFKKVTKGLWSKITKAYKKARKRWLAFGGVTLTAGGIWLLNGFGLYADVVSLTSDTASSGQVGAVGEAVAGLTTQQEESFKELNEKLDVTLNCKNIRDDWSVENSLNIENQYILLKDGVEAGSVRFFKAFKDTFVLKFTFIPDVVQGTNSIFSIKDDQLNELRVSIADDVSDSDQDSDLDYFGVKLISSDGTEKDLNSGASSQILPVAKSGEEILLQVQTLQMASSLNASAFIVYTPARKVSEKSSLNLINTEIPNFSGKSVRLNVGMRRVEDTNPGIKVVDCVIQQIS